MICFTRVIYDDTEKVWVCSGGVYWVNPDRVSVVTSLSETNQDGPSVIYTGDYNVTVLEPALVVIERLHSWQSGYWRSSR